jgi:hypothetical protein
METGIQHIVGSALTAALVLFIIYRRFRRNFGRQPLRPTRMAVRIALFAIIAVLLAPAALRASDGALAIGVGLALGLGLGIWAGRRTRFERFAGQLHYIPHTYTGMVVSALFLCRLIYRLVVPHNGYSPAQAGPQDPAAAFGSIYQNPLTLGIFFVLIAYYLYYYSYVLWESNHLKAEDLEVPPAAN